MAADFVDPIDIFDHAVRRIQLLHRLIARGADRFGDALIDRVVRLTTAPFYRLYRKLVR